MAGRFDRVARLLGENALARLAESAVLVAGLGGVGALCAETLVRSGVGRVDVVDGECIEPSNSNRQILSLDSTMGRRKVEVFSSRAHDISPHVAIEGFPWRLNRDTIDRLDLARYDAVADAIDSLIPKLNLIIACLERDVAVFSSTGAGFKIDPGAVRVASIWETGGDRLAHRMRKKLRQWGHGDKDFQVVHSTELPPPSVRSDSPSGEIGALMTVTGTFALRLAHLVLIRLTSSCRSGTNTGE